VLVLGDPTTAASDLLTEREQQVLRLLDSELRGPQIAAERPRGRRTT